MPLSPLHYTSTGSGAPVVLVHGMAASLHDWDWIAPPLAQAGCRALAVDLLGHGDSPKPSDPAQYHIECIYEHFAAWLGSLNLPEKPLLVGHSLGGHLCLLHALHEPDAVRGLVLVDPFYTPKQLSPTLRLLRRQPGLGVRTWNALPQWLINFAGSLDPGAKRFPLTARRQIAADYTRASPNILYITQSITDLTPRLRRVHHPALVMWGTRDLTLSPQSFPRLVRVLPRARGEPVPGCGHQPHIGRPALVAREVLEFIGDAFSV